MTGQDVRTPWTVSVRRFWRKSFRSQSPAFKVTAALTAAVLAAGVGAAIVGVGGSGTSTLQTANGSGNGNGGAAGPSASASAAPGHGTPSGSSSGHGSGQGSGSGSGGGTTTGAAGCHNAAGSTDHGVTASTINVVFPIPNLGAVQSAFAFGSNFGSEDTADSIHAYVDSINKHGGINCRKINPIEPQYDPTNDDAMRALCKKYTVDSPAFAFIDVLGAWHDANQLCVTQEGHTPLLSPWTTTTTFLHQGAPNLWWTGPDLCNVMRNLVHWAVSSQTITSTTKFGVVYTTNSADINGYKQCLQPALVKAGLKARDTAQLTYSTSPNASTSQAPVYASRFHAEGITAVIPMLPFFQFVAWIQGEQAQHYAPRLLLSDYDSMFQIALGLVGEAGSGNQAHPTPYTAQLNNQSGPTYYVLGNADFPPYASSLGDQCNKVWLQYYPHASGKSGNFNIETTGTAMTTCQNLELFKAAATMAGNNLTRAAFDANLAKLTNFNGGTIPNFRFGPGLNVGPHQVRIVSVHDNTDDACPKKLDHGNQGNCWLVKSGWSEQVLAPI